VPIGLSSDCSVIRHAFIPLSTAMLPMPPLLLLMPKPMTAQQLYAIFYISILSDYIRRLTGHHGLVEWCCNEKRKSSLLIVTLRIMAVSRKI